MTGDPSGASGLEAELDELYRAPLAEFIERRDALAKRLKIAGAAEPARATKALRKPTAVAWAINRLYFDSLGTKGRDAGTLASLEAASEALRGALRDPRSAEQRREAIDERRRALDAATTAVVAILEAAGTSVSPSLLRRIERTLLAIAAGGGGPNAPAPGRLDQELEPPGFEAVLDFPAPQPPSPKKGAAPEKPAAPAKSAAPAKVPPAKKAPVAKTPAAKASPGSADRAYVPSRDRKREAALAAAQRAVDDADADLERATTTAETARARVDDAEKVLEKARREVEAARRALVAARARLSDRRRDLDRIRRAQAPSSAPK